MIHKIKQIILSFFIFFTISFAYSSKTVNIFPIEKKQSAGIYVKKGDELCFQISGKWILWDGYETVGEEGYKSITNEHGNLGALLAKIGNNEPFVIKKELKIISKHEGVLYLFPNKGKYKIKNQSGSLSVNIDGGIDIENFISQLSKTAKKIIFDIKDGFISTDIYIEKGDTLEIHAFGDWTMWDGYYPKVSAEGHDFIADNDRWGKLYGAIGSTYGEYIEIFPIGEKTKFISSKSGILSLYPYSNNFVSIKNGTLNVYVIGGKTASNKNKEDIDELVRQNIESLVLSRINELRGACLLPKLEINPTLSKTAFNHAKYMIINDSFKRDEEKGKPNFTGTTLKERLKKLGYEEKSQEMFCQTESAVDAVDLFINTVYHRLKLLSPDLKYIGYGGYKSMNKTIHVFDFGYLNEYEDKKEWERVIYPPNNAKKVKVSWSGYESPDPFPSGTLKPLGFPASIMFNKKIKKVLKSELIDENGKTITCFIITPETDLNNKRLNAIILVPKEILCFNTKYTVNIEVKIGEHQEHKAYTWSFTTEKP